MASEVWPIDGLEHVSACPFCAAKQRTLAHDGVQDWAFACAPGDWSYWLCGQCQAIYLNPRPTRATIGDAYASYYTHAQAGGSDWAAVLKTRLRNEYWSGALRTNIEPRLGLPSWLAWTLGWLKPFIAEPFGLRQWAQERKGLLIDVGCGNGQKLKTAAQLGWQTLGIEMDAAAVQAAQGQGLQVVQGGYELLEGYVDQADCVVCSHVLEHVHEPLRLLCLLLAALKPRGVLLLSAPNASSDLRRHYGDSWRGLEAPRHLAIPDAGWLVTWLQAQGFDCKQLASHPLEMAIESERMRRKAMTPSSDDVRAARTFLCNKATSLPAHEDVVQLVCTRTQV